MFYLILYAITEYEPGAYDFFFEAMEMLAPRYTLPTGGVIVYAECGLRPLSMHLGALLDEKDYLYIMEFDSSRIAGTVTMGLEQFLVKYKPRDAYGRVVS